MATRDRVDVLRNAVLLSSLDGNELQTVAEIAVACRYAPDEVIVAEGDPGDAYFVVLEGRARVTQGAAGGKRVVLRVLEAGDGFGEIALLSDDHRRTATVTASQEFEALRLPAEAFRGLVRAQPGLEERFRTGVERYLREDILAASAEFGVLDPEQRQWLAEQVEVETVPAGEFLMREGDPGDRCFLIAEGRVEILRRGPDGAERQVTTLGAGVLVGEAALLTEAPRTATVRSLEPSRFLTLDRAALLRALHDEPLNRRIVEVLHIRAWPRRARGVESFERVNPDGDTVTVLRDAEHGRYHRLSAEGRFVWDRLDGNHSLRDLTLAFANTFKVFAPHRVGQIVLRLARRGFVDDASRRMDAPRARGAAWAGVLARAQGVACWTRGVSGIDGWVTALYRMGARALFTRAALLSMVVLTAAGVAVSILQAIELGAGAMDRSPSASLLWAFIPLFLASILFHEAAHALAVKHYGRIADRAGLGLYYFLPIFYVDTSDMWLSRRGPRVMVSLAGVGASALCGALAALAAWFLDLPAPAGTLLWQLAFVSFTIVVFNLNPLLELDGYYVLIDALDRPNLRRDALRWLGRSLGARGLDEPRERADLVVMGYAVGAILYLLFLCWAILMLHRLFLEDWLGAALSPEVSTIVAWGLVLVAVSANLLAVLGELRGIEPA